MGRELKRVALDFDWPLEKVWDGFLNPHYKACPHCRAGTSPAGQWLEAIVRLLMVAGEDGRDAGRRRSRGAIWPHPYLQEMATRPECDPPPALAELTGGLAGRATCSPFGHDSIDAWSACKAIIKAAGLPEDWSTCKTCGGDGIDPALKAEYEAWEPTEPPIGPGYQIWETVSEGSPISPVFATPEELARWMAGKKWGADHGSPYESWLAFINGPGWAPSMIMDASGIRSGPEAAL